MIGWKTGTGAENKYFKLFQRKIYFYVIDETEIKCKKCVDILAGLLKTPENIILVDCIQLDGAVIQ